MQEKKKRGGETARELDLMKKQSEKEKKKRSKQGRRGSFVLRKGEFVC